MLARATVAPFFTMKEMPVASQERFAFQRIEAGPSKRFQFLQAFHIQGGEVEAGLSLHGFSQSRRNSVRQLREHVQGRHRIFRNAEYTSSC